MTPTKNDKDEWVFADAWPEAARQAWAAMRAEAEREEAAAAQVAQDAEVDANGVEAHLQAARAAVDAAKAKREQAERDAADEALWRYAQTKYGARVGRVYTGGGWLVLRFNSEQEWELIKQRAAIAVRAALEAPGEIGPDERATNADRNSVLAFREGILTMSLVTREGEAERKADIARARKLCSDYHGVWTELYQLREDLNRGPREVAGKGGAR